MTAVAALPRAFRARGFFLSHNFTSHTKKVKIYNMQKKSEIYFLLGLLLVIAILTLFIFRPFIYVLFLAVVVATAFQPLYKRILKSYKERSGLASLTSTIIVLIIVIVPVSFLTVQVFREASSLYLSVANNNSGMIASNTTGAIEKIKQVFPIFKNVSFDFSRYAEQILQKLLPYWGTLLANVISIITSIFIFLIALYYMFKDGEKLKKAILELSPLKDSYDRTIFSKMQIAINSIVKGNLIVAILQGAVTAVGFLIFGVPSAILWGTVTSIAALVPSVGTSLVVFPAVLFLFFTGSPFASIGLALWGIFAVGLIDNMLGPKLVERGIQIHPFLILLSVLGGLAMFGPIGFLVGPIVLSLLFTLTKIYSDVIHQQL